MAEVLTEFSPRFMRRNQKHRWQDWFDGNVWRLTRGIDFKILLTSFRASACTAARERGYRLKYQCDYANGVIEIQAIKKGV